jgi:hypothetical protein
MEWTIKPYREANHPPAVAPAENTPEEFAVHSGQEFHLNAAGSHDRDGGGSQAQWPMASSAIASD